MDTRIFALRLWVPVLLAVLSGLGPAGCTTVNAVPESPGASACPQWAQDPADIHDNQPSPYLGCTNDVNLLRMVERPQDLQQGRTLGPTSGERQANAVKAYDTGQVKPFIDSATNKTTGSAQ